MFAMGFLCGLVAWTGRGLYDRIGMAGDSIVGIAVAVVFFLACMIAFAPDLLGAKFRNGGLPMLGLAIVAGAICGPWFARGLAQGEMTPLIGLTACPHCLTAAASASSSADAIKSPERGEQVKNGRSRFRDDPRGVVTSASPTPFTSRRLLMKVASPHPTAASDKPPQF